MANSRHGRINDGTLHRAAGALARGRPALAAPAKLRLSQTQERKDQANNDNEAHDIDDSIHDAFPLLSEAMSLINSRHGRKVPHRPRRLDIPAAATPGAAMRDGRGDGARRRMDRIPFAKIQKKGTLWEDPDRRELGSLKNCSELNGCPRPTTLPFKFAFTLPAVP